MPPPNNVLPPQEKAVQNTNTGVIQPLKPLPTIVELYSDEQKNLAIRHDDLNMFLNQPVHAEWVKKHPFATDDKGNPLNYLPIDKIEWLLTKIFIEWRVKVIGYSQIFNAVAVHIRLKVRNPITGKWMKQDGLGAVGIQTNKGASAADFTQIKFGGVMMALPAAESYAIKDAAEKFGRIFGSNLNRKDTAGFAPSFSDSDKDEKTKKAEEAAKETMEEMNAKMGKAKPKK